MSIFDQIINAQLSNLAHTCQTGISFIDDVLGGISPKDLWVVGGRTGFGKTEFCTQVGSNMARKEKRVALLALEAERNEIHARLHFKKFAEMYFGEAIGDRPKTGCDVTYKNYYKGHLSTPELVPIQKLAWQEIEDVFDNFEILYPLDMTGKDIGEFIEVDGEDFHAILVDHVNYLEHPGKNEFEGVIEAIKLIRSRALHREKPVILVSHMRKRTHTQKGMITLDDLHGSSEISKRATAVILVERGKPNSMRCLVESGSQKPTSPTIFHIPKDRHGGAPINYYGVHNFDITHQKYSDEYVLMEKDKQGNLEYVEKLPRWAKNAIDVHASRLLDV